MEYEYFTAKELECNCGECDGEMSPAFMVKMDRLRDACGFPFVVTSAYRCRRYNAKIGGVTNSKHTQGKAIDIAVSGEQALKVIAYAKRTGINGVGISQRGEGRFIHLDDREDFTLWSY